jgi:hypothetical protein
VNPLNPRADRLPDGITSFLAVGLLGLSGLIHLFWLADTVAGYPLGRWLLPRDGSVNKPLAYGLIVFEGVVGHGVRVGTAVAFLGWLYTAAGNLARLGVRSPRFSPGWAVGWFFVPVWNLVRPYQVLRDVWANSGPPRRQAGDPGPRGARGPRVIKVWWACCLVSVLSWAVPQPSSSPVVESFVMSIMLSEPERVSQAAWTFLIVMALWRHGVTALAALFGMLMIWLIRRRQAEAAAAVDLRG